MKTSDFWRGTSGLYVIENSITATRYYGSARCLDSRWNAHIRALRAGCHRNDHLQRAWERYGEGAFSFRVIVVLEPGQLQATEQRLLDKVYGADCYNIATDAAAPMTGRRHTVTTRAKMAESKRGRVITWADKISAAKKGKARTPAQIAADERMRGRSRQSTYTRTPEQRRAQSERAKQWYATATPEQRTRKGIKPSAATRAKMSATRKGRKRSPESVAKSAAALRGKKKSPEFCAMMSAARMGKPGRPQGEAERESKRQKMRAFWAARKAMI